MSSDFQTLRKNLKKDFGGMRRVSIAVAGDSSTQLLVQAIRGMGFEIGVDFSVYEAGIGQVGLELLNPRSEMYASSPEFIIVFLAADKAWKKFAGLPAGERGDFAAGFLAEAGKLAEAVKEYSGAKLIFFNLPMLDDAVFGHYANKVTAGWVYQQRRINMGLMDLAMQQPHLFVADIDLLQARLGNGLLSDSRLHLNADMSLSVDFLPHAAKAITDIVRAVKGDIRKCLVLDLDNTLWGGVIGDDGLEHIQLGELGVGKAFVELQLWVKQLKERGIILAVCSKNTESIAREPFEKHPDMVLRMEDIAVFVANWESKVDNIRHIRSVLNIGFDAMVFLDDNAFERNMVRENIPELIVPELPEDPAGYLECLRSLNLFETASFTAEDEQRTRQYREEAGRVEFQRSFTSENEYLASLGMVAEVKPFDTFTLPRIAQLSQRSNQFNLRTVRYTESDLAGIVADKKYHTLSFSLRDKFGDYGLIGAVILEERGEALFIDTWFMSCRVLKRGMENFITNRMVAIARENGFQKITGEYLPTAKNGLVAGLLEEMGFVKDELWQLDVEIYRERETQVNAAL